MSNDLSKDDVQGAQDDVKGSEASNSVAYETYDRVMGALKKRESENSSIKSQLEEYKRRDLESQGKHDEVIASLKSENERLSIESKETRKNYTKRAVESSFIEEAKSRGCNMDPKRLFKMYESDKDSLSILEADDDHNIFGMDRLMDQVVKDNSNIFKPEKVRMVDGVPRNKIPQKKPVDVKSMTIEEIYDYAEKNKIK